MTRVVLSVALFLGVLALIDYALTGGNHVQQVSHVVMRAIL